MTRLVVHPDIRKSRINKNIYGHFAEHLGQCIYGGLWVGLDSDIPNTDGLRNDVIEALRAMRIPVLRWPGGCFADEYHWQDGIGPAEQRPRMVNTHWGGVVEDNHFGTHEFLRLCELLGAEPYICGNLGSGTVQEMQQWIEYMTFDGESPMANLRRANGRDKPWKVTFFGVGNENWGCGGNMRPEYYADEYRRYATYVRNFGSNQVYKIACGPNVDNYAWTEVLMREAGNRMQGLSLHYYSLPRPTWDDKGAATGFDESEWFSTLRQAAYMDELIRKHAAIMDRYDPDKKVGLIVDEWGTWYNVEPGTNPGFLFQQNTIRDAVVAAINLNLFNNHSDRVRMANIAQLVNVLQSVILTENDRMILTPTYHVFQMFAVHQNAELLQTELECSPYRHGGQAIDQVSVSASIDDQQQIHISLSNLDPHASVNLECVLTSDNEIAHDVAMAHRPGDASYHVVKGTVLTGATLDAHNTFAEPGRVLPQDFHGAIMTSDGLQVKLPPRSVVVLTLVRD